MTKKHYQVADLTLDTSARRLTRGGRDVDISSRAFDVLEYLIERRGTLVEKSELMERVWFDSFVEEANLAVHISAIRRLLNEKKGEPRFIKTISGRGYSFIGQVSELNAPSDMPPVYPLLSNAVPETGFSIAVLPFGFSGASEDLTYLAEAVTNTLIDDISRMPGLKVIAYSAVKSYRDSAHDPQEIGFLLGASKILTGFITEFRGRLEVRAELVNTGDRARIWGGENVFEADDVFQIRKDISDAICRELKIKLSEAGLRGIETPSISPAAQKLYFRGKFVLESRTFNSDVEPVLYQALGLFQQAIEAEPAYALAYTGIGAVYGALFNHGKLNKQEAYDLAMAAADTALELDERLSQAYVLKASVMIMFERMHREGLECLERATELNGNNADAHHWKSLSYMMQGRFDEALEMELQATRYDPISTRFTTNIARIFFMSEQFEKSIAHAEELLEFETKDAAIYLFLALSHAFLGRYEIAQEMMDKAVEHRYSSDMLMNSLLVSAMRGDRELVYRRIDEIQNIFPNDGSGYVCLGSLYVALGEYDLAFEAMEAAVLHDDADINIVGIDPRFKELRKDPRFATFYGNLIPNSSVI